MNAFLEYELQRSRTSTEAIAAMAQDQESAGAILAAIGQASPGSRVSGYTLDEHGRLAMTVFLNPARASSDAEAPGAPRAVSPTRAPEVPLEGTKERGEYPTREEFAAIEAAYIERATRAAASLKAELEGRGFGVALERYPRLGRPSFRFEVRF